MVDQFVFREQPMQLTHIEDGVLQPSDAKKRRSRFGGISDFRVAQSAEAKKITLAHDHPNQERTGRPRKLCKLPDELEFIRGQEVPVPFLERRQNGFEVIQVVERIREDWAA